MSGDSFTEVTSESWFSRIGSSIKGILFGLILFVIAFPLLFWNEGRAVERYKSLQEGSGLVVSIDASRIDPSKEGSLVHVSGLATTESSVQDPEFGVRATALRLRRSVEMYQWEEKTSSKSKKKLGGGTETEKTYTYSKTWASRVIDSSSFKRPNGHKNPMGMEFQSSNFKAANVTLGAFRLSDGQVGQISSFTPLAVSVDTLPPTLGGRVTATSGGYYIGEGTEGAPRVGDLRVTFSVVKPREVSVIAKQSGTSFIEYQTTVGGTIQMLHEGTKTAEEMFKKAQDDNAALTWILRVVGFVVMFIGLNLMFRPLSVVADILPFAGGLVAMGTGFVALVVAAVCSLITVGIAWVFYRPLIGGTLLVVAGAFLFSLKSRKNKVAASGAVPPPPPPQ